MSGQKNRSVMPKPMQKEHRFDVEEVLIASSLSLFKSKES
jgi:hypothetical protein